MVIVAAFKMQLSLSLPAPKKKGSHGGARPGAGRPAKMRKPGDPLPHVARPKLDRHQPAHVTLRVARGLPSLRKQLVLNRVRKALHAARKKAEDGAPFHVVHFSVEADHIHLVVEARSTQGLSRGIAGLEIRIARALNGLLDRSGKVFPDRYHRRDLSTPTDVRNVLRYVLNNARKHVTHIGHGAYAIPTTSGESFDGWSQPVEVFRSLDDDTEPWPRIACWTWLLRVGWKRRGLISPFAIPGARRRP